MFFEYPFKKRLPTKREALPGRENPVFTGGKHAVLGKPLTAPFPNHLREVTLGLGCFWGAEQLFWNLAGTYVTAVGYAGGFTRNPNYQETCSGGTGHAEVVLVVYDPQKLSLASILRVFWEAHDPTQGFRQGNDQGTQYRSAIFVNQQSDFDKAMSSARKYQSALSDSGYGKITTEIAIDKIFYHAEEYHQQYLHKTKGGYCGLQGTGVLFPKKDK